jgi:uncharacterized membrane protein
MPSSRCLRRRRTSTIGTLTDEVKFDDAEQPRWGESRAEIGRGNREGSTMPKLMKAVTVEKPVHEVFEYIDEPAHLPEIWPSLYEVKDVKFTPQERKFQWLYNFAGKRFAGKTETIEHVQDERIVEKTFGDIESTFVWKFQGQNGFTKIAFEADYELPPAIEPKMKTFLVKRNELEADVMLENLKARLEI